MLSKINALNKNLILLIKGQLGNNAQVFVTPEECVYGKVFCFLGCISKKMSRYCHSPGDWRRPYAKTLKFSNISVITEDKSTLVISK